MKTKTDHPESAHNLWGRFASELMLYCQLLLAILVVGHVTSELVFMSTILCHSSSSLLGGMALLLWDAGREEGEKGAGWCGLVGSVGVQKVSVNLVMSCCPQNPSTALCWKLCCGRTARF
jgi:hypothetical protein